MVFEVPVRVNVRVAQDVIVSPNIENTVLLKDFLSKTAAGNELVNTLGKKSKVIILNFPRAYVGFGGRVVLTNNNTYSI